MHWLNATTMASLVSKMGPLSVLHLLFLFSINIIIDPYVHNTFQYKHFMFDFPISKVLRIWLSGDICYLIAHFSLSLKTLLPDCIFSPRHCSLSPPPETSATSIHLQITPAFVFFSHYKCKDSCFPPLPLLQLPILLFSELLAGNFMCLGHFLQMTNHFPFSYMDNLQEVKFKIKISCLKFISYKLSRPVLYNGLYHWQQTPPFKMKNKF